ncbi:MAG: carbohydrate-binding family 9-like protein [Lentisphaerae bacterium]|nr:carbohydrate-binding family 9-like protein [Lentisphaerota bacterium]
MTEPKRATITRLSERPVPSPERTSSWDCPPWRHVPELVLNHHMGEKPAHYPRVAAKLGWDADAVYVAFHVDDRYVRAVARQHQDCVCTDSCVEFFFCPGADVSKGYFNLEMNCGGTVLFHYQLLPRQHPVPLAPEHLAMLDINRSLPHLVEPEIQEPVSWFVECRVPFAALEPYLPFPRPRTGDTWRGNLYKCGDNTSHPHWLTWSPIDRPRPDFHVPDQFASLVLG